MSDQNMIVDQAAGLANAAQELAHQAAALALVAGNNNGVDAVAGGHDFLMTGIIIFTLACFVGYHVVWRVTPALHSPLMAITNAISSVIIVGALLAAGLPDMSIAKAIGFVAVVLAAINIFGGFMVTRRMLAMFKKKTLVSLFIAAFIFTAPMGLAFACGSHTPEELAARAQSLFDRYDINQDSEFDLAEFLGSTMHSIGNDAKDLTKVEFYQEVIKNIDVFKQGDKDYSEKLSFQEWREIKPNAGLTLRGGCGSGLGLQGEKKL